MMDGVVTVPIAVVDGENVILTLFTADFPVITTVAGGLKNTD